MSIKFKYAMKKFLLPLIIFLLLIPLAKAVSDKNTTTTTTTITETTTITITEPSDKSDKIIKKQEDIFEKVKTVDTSMKFFGTEYTAEEPATIWLQLLRNYQPLNNATCYITAYQPNKTIFLNKTLMNYLDGSDGVYYYDLTAPSILGVYMLSANCKIPQDAFVDDFIDYSKLEDWKNTTIQNGKVLLSAGFLELPDYETNITGNILLYHLNEPSGMIIDYSGKGNNGTTFDVSYGVEGKFNTALWFNGISSVVGVVESSSWKPADSVTVEAWVKFDEIKDSIETVVGGYSASNGYWLGINPQGNLVYFYLNGVYNYYVVYGLGFSNNTWYHLAGTYDRYGGLNNHRIYVNGQIIGQRTSTGAISNYNQLKIGSVYGTYRFKGTIDEVAIFNRSLNESEISNHYNRGVGLPMTNGFIQSKPISLSNSSWVNFFSNYNLNSGSITFKILDQNNNTLCTGLGNIQTCAGATSPIKLYAKLTRSENLTSPEIDRWWVSWLLSSFEEIKGAGEMHVSTTGLTNETINEITDDVIIKMLQNARILNQRVVNFHNQQYCIDNSTLRHNITYDYCVGNNCKVMKDIMDEICQYDCNYQLSVCNKPPYQNALVIAGGIAGFIVFILVVLRLAGRI